MILYQVLLLAFFSGSVLLNSSFEEETRFPNMEVLCGKDEKSTSVKPHTQMLPDLPVCHEIEKYPAVFSYVTEDLKKELDAKCITTLTLQQKNAAFLNPESFLEEVFSDFFQVFAVNKINYSTSTLMVYLVEEVQQESLHEMDRLLLVIYDKDGMVKDVLSKNLQDPFSTREFNFTSNQEFNVVDTNSEYSQDPESEAEDTRNGRGPEPNVSTLFYQIDPVKMKFRILD